MFIFFDVILVNFYELTIPILGIDSIDYHEDLRADFIVHPFFTFEWYF